MNSLTCFCISLITFSVCSQNFTRRDSLQGSLRHERTSFDVLHYHLSIKIDPDKRHLSGYNEITFRVVEPTQKIQIDLFENMVVDSILYHSELLSYEREYDAVFIYFPETLPVNTENSIRFYYSGKPQTAVNAPWDGGFVWKKDKNGMPFIGVAVQGTGASLWYPVKDHQTDEPDRGAIIQVAVPKGLMNVSNGRFTGKKELEDDYIRWDWEVKNPINNYTITVNIADYVHISDHHKGLDIDYYVLRENEAKAQKHFSEVKPMLDCFQERFGKYPFIEDGYKLVETPYLGMEHQSAIAYGNQYRKGYLGSDMTGTGIGLLFDYITIHETGHEWFGNSITSKDIADMWIHESFTTYSETVFVECQFGYEKAMKYINGQKRLVANTKPVIGQFGVNYKSKNSDMYYKGALMLNTIRHIINDDEIWWNLLKEYSETFRHQIIETRDVILFFNNFSGLNLTPVFKQYLKNTTPPVLEIYMEKDKVWMRWQTDLKEFEMPVEYTFEGKSFRKKISTKWTKTPDIKTLKDMSINKEKFYIQILTTDTKH